MNQLLVQVLPLESRTVLGEFSRCCSAQTWPSLPSWLQSTTTHSCHLQAPPATSPAARCPQVRAWGPQGSCELQGAMIGILTVGIYSGMCGH